MKITNPTDLSAKGVKNIIFDWGGVLINIDYNATIEAFRRMGITNFDSYYTQARQKDLFDRLEIGAISPADFRDAFRAELKVNISDDDIDSAWCKMLFDIPQQRIKMLQSLGKNYNIFLLSNTNIIHEEMIVPRVNEELGFEFFSLFQKVYLSHRVGMRKPNANIFEFVLEENGLLKEETLFVDDSEQHIDGASAIGIPSFFLQAGMETAKIFESWAE